MKLDIRQKLYPKLLGICFNEPYFSSFMPICWLTEKTPQWLFWKRPHRRRVYSYYLGHYWQYLKEPTYHIWAYNCVIYPDEIE